MSLISSSIPSLVNGVSQQVETQRSTSQSSEQINFISSIAHGLKRRPPTRHIARLTDDDWAGAALHVINRDTSERYVVAITDGDLRVFDIDGDEKTVSFPSGKAYLTAASPSADFRAVTVADVSFILNKTVTAAMSSATSPTRPAEGLIHVRLGNYGRTYRISIDGVERALYTTPDGSAASHSSQIDTSFIAQQLETDLIAANIPGISITRLQNAIHIVKSSGDFAVAVEDGFNGEAMKVAKGQLQRFSDLPEVGPDGFHLEIIGDQTTAFDNYYVAFDKTAAESSDGVWRETVAQGVITDIDPATMPHVLRREADGSFTFEPASWTSRGVGDDDSAPAPSFVGRKINDVFFFRNRLGLLADESVILSRAGDFFNFWPKSTTAQLDSDPIDIAGAHNQVSILQHATPFNRSLLLFSDQTQFVMNAGDLLTPATASLQVASSFSGSLRAKPVLAGKRIFFGVERGGSAGVREFFVDDLGENADAADITAHTPTYVPEGITSLVASDRQNMLLILSEKTRNVVYVYKYYWDRDQKLQSAWSQWRFAAGDAVLSAAFIDAKVLLVVARGDGAFLEEIDLDDGAAEPGLDVLFHADRRVTEADCSVATIATDGGVVTRLTLPFAETEPLWVLTAADDAPGAGPPGRALNHTRPSATEVEISGDVSSSKLVIGRRYLSRYVFSPFYAREFVANASSALGEGRLQILYLTMFFEKAGAFRIKVTPRAEDVFTYEFSGRVAGAGANKLGVPAVESGKFKAPIYAENTAVEIALEADGASPVSFVSAEWEARLSLRSRRR